MPEGDTLRRTAETLDRWLSGRVLTSASVATLGGDAVRLAGATVEKAESRGKHLLVRLRTPAGVELVVHTHLGLHGSWHVYPAGARWRRAASRARVVLEAGDRVAVCFDAPVVEVTAAATPRAIAGLGPDVLADPVDLGGVVRRAAARPPAQAIGEVLLDQRVVAGIGNIWRCEALFAERINPWTPVAAVGEDGLRRLVATASRLMRAARRGAGAARPTPQVYRRPGRPCPRCGSAVRSQPQGPNARIAYWCATCQPAPAGTIGR